MKSIAKALIPLVVSTPAHAAVEVFFCVPEVTGTCPEVSGAPKRSDGWIAAGAIAFGATNQAPASDPYAPGVASLGAVEVIKAIDDTSPTWFLYALQGTPVDLRIAMRKAGGTSAVSPFVRAEYTAVTLTVSQVQQTGDDLPRERLTFEHPDGHVFRYWKQKADGSLLNPPLTSTWPGTP